MTEQSARTVDRANPVTDLSVGNHRRALRLNGHVMRKSRNVFPVKTAHHLSEITGYSVRAAERWLSERVVIPADALAALLQSEWGKDFLAAVMTDNTPRWWLRLKAWLDAIDLAAEERKHRRKLRELLDDAQKPGATALLLQDEDFYEGQPSPARALAPAKGLRR
jgi:hypothetical protein